LSSRIFAKDAMMTAEAALQSLSPVASARWKSGGESNAFLMFAA